jgi:hypothetical protein
MTARPREASRTTKSVRSRGRSPIQALETRYRSLERKFTVLRNPDYESLVVPNGNAIQGIHRWFHLKEAFSRRLLARVLKDTGLANESELSVLDPFAGSGTTAISIGDAIEEGTLRSAHFVGYECNPFLHLVASCKLGALQTPSLGFFQIAKRIAALAARDKVDPLPLPDLSAFHDERFFDPQALRRLLQLRAAIDHVQRQGAEMFDVNLALLCLGASVEPVSSLRRDGRALRFTPDKDRSSPIQEFRRRAEWVDEDMPRHRLRVKGRVVLGDGVALTPRPPREASVDLALFSPPYPNNIDYTEVYKLEAWLLGFISNSNEFAAQRLKTVYSHPSLLRQASGTTSPETSFGRCGPGFTLARLRDAVPADRYERARKAMIHGYAKDMLRTLESSYAALRPGGRLVFVVGNSLHGGDKGAFVIAADLLLAELSLEVGFEVERIEVARQLRRRLVSSHFLRESVVFLRRPKSSRR